MILSVSFAHHNLVSCSIFLFGEHGMPPSTAHFPYILKPCTFCIFSLPTPSIPAFGAVAGGVTPPASSDADDIAAAGGRPGRAQPDVMLREVPADAIWATARAREGKKIRLRRGLSRRRQR
uniref:Uncharacterized protein n=1 Tax=Arundo donax TaxID=35708 RepID=A0A0A9GNJ0_ARUDO